VSEKRFSHFSKKTLATPFRPDIILIVPLDDCFGDWATPKKSKAGHFFALDAHLFDCRAACPLSCRWN
jgi:hypothetical protein